MRGGRQFLRFLAERCLAGPLVGADRVAAIAQVDITCGYLQSRSQLAIVRFRGWVVIIVTTLAWSLLLYFLGASYGTSFHRVVG